MNRSCVNVHTDKQVKFASKTNRIKAWSDELERDNGVVIPGHIVIGYRVIWFEVLVEIGQ